MMGAWNCLVAIGLFTVTGGCERPPQWMVTAPLFERAMIRHVDGSVLTIRADAGVANDGRAGAVRVNGTVTSERRVLYSIAAGSATIDVDAVA